MKSSLLLWKVPATATRLATTVSRKSSARRRGPTFSSSIAPCCRVCRTKNGGAPSVRGFASRTRETSATMVSSLVDVDDEATITNSDSKNGPSSSLFRIVSNSDVFWMEQTKEVLSIERNCTPTALKSVWQHWFSRKGCLQANDYLWQLYERYQNEPQYAFLLERAVDHWRHCVRRNGGKQQQQQRTPQQIWDIVRPTHNEKLYSMLVHGLPAMDSNATQTLALEILHYYQAALSQQTMQDNTILWNSLLQTLRDASLSKSILQSMQRPTMRTYSFVLKQQQNPQSALDLWETVQSIQSTNDKEEDDPNVGRSICLLHVLQVFIRQKDETWWHRAKTILYDIVDTQCSEHFPPNNRWYSILLTKFAQVSDQNVIHELLQHLHVQSQRFPDLAHCRINAHVLNSVLVVYAKQRTETAAKQAQNLLDTAAQKYGVPMDHTSVNTVLDAWANCGTKHAVERAERLLETALPHPDTVSYNILFKAYRTAQLPDLAPRSEQWLSQVNQPDRILWNAVLHAWSMTPHDPNAPLHVERLYQSMLEQNLQPNLDTYTSLIMAWGHCQRPESHWRAQLYFDQLWSKYLQTNRTQEEWRPNYKMYTALLASRAQDGPGAESVLQRMYEDHLQFKGVRPNRPSFHAVLLAWKDDPSHKPDAPDRIYRLLQQMQREDRKWDVAPQTSTYLILLRALAQNGDRAGAQRVVEEMRSKRLVVNGLCYAALIQAHDTGQPQDAERAQQVFDDMMERYLGGDTELRPSGLVYGSLLQTWANSKHPDAGRNATAVLNEMADRHAIHNEEPAVGVFHYSLVMNAFANMGDVDNTKKLLQRLVEDGCQPDRHVINGLLKAYSRSDLDTAVEEAARVVQDMKAKWNLQPNVVSYSSLIVCLSRSGRSDAYMRAKELIKTMKDLSDRGERSSAPNAFSFSTLINLLANAPSDGVDHQKEADWIDQIMKDLKVQPGRASTKLMQQIRNKDDTS